MVLSFKAVRHTGGQVFLRALLRARVPLLPPLPPLLLLLLLPPLLLLLLLLLPRLLLLRRCRAH
jgi:hypothetical protein